MTAASVQDSLIGPTSEAAGIGFKEWAVVCAALGSGRQSLILRKGGIAEGRDGFRFKHERFFLFPTQYHQQFERVRPEERAGISDIEPAEAGTIAIQLLFVVDFAVWVSDHGAIARLEPFHVWRDDVIRERFAYDEQPGLQCAFGRVYRAEQPWTFADRPSFGGCRSWLTLPAPPADLSWRPVIDLDEHVRRRQEVRRMLGLQ